ncbi:cupin domain-containing protein [Pedobacter hiemivivus]|uniref:Cupin domain-containing protein n=1 Tax=Pedobacter hiemivivus TaxID=2530454 RepID=A0A4U1GBS0_9SPHI|nr:cupin domain-containing protein [Pedobacter hiemivivus]TKC61367.1 cupin domain-containing protein [Pedobacter hiemivivus]
MKTMKITSMLLLLGLLLTLSTNVYAQDPMTAAPNAYKKVLLENEKVRVMQIEIAPGEVVPWHSHPDHVIYALTDGKLEITEKDKAATVAEIKAGEAMFMPAVTHTGKNIGETTLKLIVTELKQGKASKMDKM